MATILRFVDPATHSTVRLDLNSTSGFQLLRGLDLGSPDIEEETLSQQPFDGEEVTASRRPRVQMSIPVRMTTQASVAAMKTLYDLLAIELDRATNAIEYRPSGAAASYFFTTYRAPIPSLTRGEDSPAPFFLLADPRPMVLAIMRDPQATGAGAYI